MFDTVGIKPLTQTCVEYLSTLKEMCGEQVYAYVWLEQLLQTAVQWDHLTDKGDKHDPEAINAIMLALITEWPINPFLRKNADFITPTLVASISAWRFNKSRDLHYSAYREVPCAVAFIIGGHKLVDKFMPKISELVLKLREEDDARDNKEKTNAEG